MGSGNSTTKSPPPSASKPEGEAKKLAEILEGLKKLEDTLMENKSGKSTTLQEEPKSGPTDGEKAEPRRGPVWTSAVKPSPVLHHKLTAEKETGARPKVTVVMSSPVQEKSSESSPFKEKVPSRPPSISSVDVLTLDPERRRSRKSQAERNMEPPNLDLSLMSHLNQLMDEMKLQRVATEDPRNPSPVPSKPPEEPPGPVLELEALNFKVQGLKERVEGFMGGTSSRQFEHLKTQLLCCEAQLDDVECGKAEEARKMRKQLRLDIHDALQRLCTSDALE